MSSDYEQACIALGRRIQRRREKLGLNPTDLSAAVGVSRAALSDWETGKYPPHYKHLQKLAKALKMPVTRLIPLAGIEVSV